MENNGFFLSPKSRKIVLTVIVLAGILLAITLIFISGLDDFLALAFKSLQVFFFGLLFACLLTPTEKFFERNLKKLFAKYNKDGSKASRIIAVALAAVLFLAVVIGIVLLIVPQLTDSLKILIPNLDKLISGTSDRLKNLSTSSFYQNTVYPIIQDFLSNLTEWINSHIGVDTEFFANATSTITSAIGTLGNAFVGLVIAIYMMLDKERLFAQIRKLCMAIFKQKSGPVVIDAINEGTRIFSGFFGAKLIEAVANGALCFAAMLIFNLPYAALISVIIGVTNIIPFFGPWVGLIVSVLLILITSPSSTLLFLIIGIVLMIIDGNLLGPKILGKSTGLSALWVIVAIFFFGGLFGFTGMLIGVPLLAWILYLVKKFSEASLQKQGLPTDTQSYLKKKKTDNP